MTKTQPSAILIFSRTKVHEARAKSFSSKAGKSGNQKIAHTLIRHTFKTARQTGLPVFTSFSTQQKGQTFGERLAHSIEEIFAKGFQKIITIGNDCPTLSAATLLEADTLLQQHDTVIGPSTDGGIYLLGLSKNTFSKKEFIHFSWKKNNLIADLEFFLNKTHTSFASLEILEDIDNEIDFLKYLNSNFSFGKLKSQLLQIISHCSKIIFSNTFFLPSKNRIAIRFLRAPPFF